MLILSTRRARRIRAYSSTRTILHLLEAEHLCGVPAYRRSLRVGPFSTRILGWGWVRFRQGLPMREPSFRYYVRAGELKAAGMVWTEVLELEEDNSRAAGSGDPGQ